MPFSGTRIKSIDGAATADEGIDSRAIATKGKTEASDFIRVARL